MNIILHFLRAVLFLLLMFVGLLAALVGLEVFWEWRDLPLPTILYYGLSFLAGVALALLCLVLLFTRPAILRWAAVAASGLLFLNQTVGIWLNTLLCFTPG